eukprot:1136852-Pelagomonas_calceolata.AAC.6
MAKVVEYTMHPKVHTLFVRAYKHVQKENHITDKSTKQPFLESTKAPHIREVHWHFTPQACPLQTGQLSRNTLLRAF